MCTPSNTSSLGLPDSASKTASWSVQPFSHSSHQTVPILYNGPPLRPENRPFTWKGSGPHLMHGSLGPPESTCQTTSDRFSHFCRAHDLDILSDRQTDKPCYSVCNNRVSAYAVLWCGLIIQITVRCTESAITAELEKWQLQTALEFINKEKPCTTTCSLVKIVKARICNDD